MRRAVRAGLGQDVGPPLVAVGAMHLDTAQARAGGVRPDQRADDDGPWVSDDGQLRHAVATPGLRDARVKHVLRGEDDQLGGGGRSDLAAKVQLGVVERPRPGLDPTDPRGAQGRGDRARHRPPAPTTT